MTLFSVVSPSEVLAWCPRCTFTNDVWWPIQREFEIQGL